MATTRREAQTSTPDNHQVIAAFLRRKDRIDALLEALRNLSDEHFNVEPDAVHWGHVGNLDLWLQHLEQIASFEGLATDDPAGSTT